jgi:hypothetical protein
MGAQVSASNNTSESYINAITESILQSSSSCRVSLTQSQILEFGAVSGDFRLSNFSQDASGSVDLTCFQADANTQEIRNNIEQVLKQQAEAAVSGQTFGLQTTLTNNNTRAITNVVNSIDVSMVKECIASTLQSQVIKVQSVDGNVFIDNTRQTLLANAVAECIQNNTNTMTAINELKTTVDQTAKGSAAGFLNATTLIIIAIIIVLLLSTSSMFLFIRSSMKGDAMAKQASN